MITISAVVSVALESITLDISDVYLPKVCGLTDIQASCHTNNDEMLAFLFLYLHILHQLGVRLLDAYATSLSFPWLSFCMRHPPRPNLDASTCKITGLEELKYIRHASLLMLSFQILEVGFMALCPLE